MSKSAVELTKQVFRFLKAFAQKSASPTRRVSEHHWIQWLGELPNHPTISIGYIELATPGQSSGAPNEDSSSQALITIRRPRTTPAPSPPDAILEFVAPGWRDPEKAIEVVEVRNIVRRGETVTDRLADDPRRLEALAKWRMAWTAWAEAERPARVAMRVFERFFDLKNRIDRESERVELVLGDGRLRWKTANGEIDHPLLLQRVELVFDPSLSEFRLIDADRQPELYTDVLYDLGSTPSGDVSAFRTEVERGGFHPLNREATSLFLRRLIQTLAAGGVFDETSKQRIAGLQPAISRDAVLFLRNRPSGFPAAFDRVLEDVERSGEVPTSLSRLVGVESKLPPELEPADWSPWGEPPDVLLSKHANEEQIRIARALDRHKAVLVQGPPGTGKSHTIANLVGHLVAHGKRVLITSHTTKALRVLRGQIVETLRPLCVALLDNDLEGRTQMEEAVRGILNRLTNSTENSLERELASLAENRGALNRQINEVTSDLRTVREAEYQPIVVAGESILPSDAARWVSANERHSWIPGQVQFGAPLPLSLAELHDLYGTNRQINREEETEIAAGPPPIEAIPSVELIRSLYAALEVVEPRELSRFWQRQPIESDLPILQQLSKQATSASDYLASLQPWQRALVGIGHRGGTEVDLWKQLAALIAELSEQAQRSKAVLLEHDPVLPTGPTHEENARIAGQLEAHLKNGGSLGAFGLLFHSDWKPFLRSARCNGRAPASVEEFSALRIMAELQTSRERVATRWSRQSEAIGLPPFTSFGTEPEHRLREYTEQFEGLLGWWTSVWPGIMSSAREAGLQWEQFRAHEVARTGPADPFDRDVQILSGRLVDIVRWRVAVCRRAAALRILNEAERRLKQFNGARTATLLRTMGARDLQGYTAARAELTELLGKIPIAERRQRLLEKLQAAAPGWASAVRARVPGHDGSIPSTEVGAAWRWRQLRQESDRRASLDEVALTKRLHQLRADLRAVTADFIDRRAWLGQMRRIDLNARQALQGWAQIQKRIGKGTGKRVPTLQAEARGLLAKARDAVPVWIMPLSRVAESFDPTKGKFDVVIIDEASQSDVTGLLAWYLGDRVAVVGDNEQVSPSAVGERIEDVERLISQHLVDVPNAVLYDGRASVYDLAQQCFGGTIALREHFRCVPEIIDFSNYLSYNGQIRPLRDPSRVPRPHVVEHVVRGVRSDGKENEMEARTIVAIMKALTEMPQFRQATMGAISLLGDEQASLIQDLALEAMGAVALAERRFTAGNAAQFQGDERDVIFLSMVDSPIGTVLRMRQEDTLKQRYNVAASRARNQLWLVHSLDPNHDLGQGDLRRRLIEHVRNPGALREATRHATAQAESPFEREVLERLIAAGYRATPQVWVSQYRIDIVVSDGANQAAIECDGDRFHGVDQIPQDMARQAVLERAGWRFVRIRGTRFYRNPDEAMRWVFSELERLEVRRVDQSGTIDPPAAATTFRDTVVQRAWEIMRELEWVDRVVDQGPLFAVSV